MQLIGRILVLVMCLFGAYTLPTLANNNDNHAVLPEILYQQLMAEMRMAIIETPGLTPAESACANQYNNATRAVNDALVNATSLCYQKANQTTNTNNQNVNKTIELVRVNLAAVTQQIANCSVFNDTNLYLNCTTATFDFNLLHLDAANTAAYKAEAEMITNRSQVNIVYESCVDAAVGTAKINLTIVTNDYSTCLSKIKYQRVLSANAFLN